MWLQHCIVEGSSEFSPATYSRQMRPAMIISDQLCSLNYPYSRTQISVFIPDLSYRMYGEIWNNHTKQQSQRKESLPVVDTEVQGRLGVFTQLSHKRI